ncbi:MAG TPA: hypothetical protein VK195_14965 [Burkholderiaceae bacterium]|nr:hypothetical protein [Burkholderiaceae bacterium]
MLAFRLQLNDRPPITGGAPDLGVLTTTITAIGPLGPQTCRRRSDEPPEVHLRLGGLTSRGPILGDEHLVWFEAHDLKAGDRIVVDILETPSPDPVQSGSPAPEREDEERAYFEHCKKAYFEMRNQYEDREDHEDHEDHEDQA